MSEGKRGTTPASVTAITVVPSGAQWVITVDRGNGSPVQTLDLTGHERMILACLLEAGTAQSPKNFRFTDHTAQAAVPA